MAIVGAAVSSLPSSKPVGSFFLSLIIFLLYAAISSGELGIGTATLWTSGNSSSASLCDGTSSEVPPNEYYAQAGYLFNDGDACGMIYTVTCTAAIGEAGNCVADNNISVDVKIIDGISDLPSDKTLAMRLSAPAFNKIASLNATSITINYR